MLGIPAVKIINDYMNPKKPLKKKLNISEHDRNVSTVILKAELNGQLTNVLLDSGAGVSIIDERSLNRLKGSAAISNLDEDLIDASGNKMDIVGKVCIKVLIKGSRQPVFHEFRVVNTNRCTNILLGRDFLKRFGSVTFDFETFLAF